MAISATFSADFSAFQRAVQDATTKLVTFQGNAVKVQSALDKMVSNFSGVKVIQDATLMTEAIDRIGGTSKLTASELEKVGAKAQEAVEKLQAMGQDVPPKLQAIADATRQQTGLWNELTMQVGTYAAGMITATAIIGAAKGAFNAVVGEIERSLDAWGKQELATTRLNAALKAQGTYSPLASQAMQELSAEYQRNTRYADEDVQAVEALLTQIGNVLPSDMDRALKATTDLAAGLGIDLETSARLVGKAFVGHTETLARYGVVVSETELKVKGVNAVLESVEKHFGGQAKAQVDTYTGSVDQLKNAWNDVEESVGKFFASVLGPVAQDAAKKLRELQGTSTAPKAATGAIDPKAAALTQQYQLMSAEVKDASGMLEGLSINLNESAQSAAAAAVANKAYNDELSRLRQSQERLNESTQARVVTLLAQNDSESNIAKVLKISEEAVKGVADAQKKAAEYSKEWGKAIENLEPVLNSSAWDGSIESALKLGGSVHDLAIYYNVSEGVIREHKETMEAWAKVIGIEAKRPLAELEGKLKDTADAMMKVTAATIEMGQPLSGLESKLGGLGAVAKPAMNDLYNGATRSKLALYEVQDALKDMPRLMIAAFTGGGNLTGALNALGTSITSGLFGEGGALSKVTSGISNSIGGLLSKGLGSTLGGVLGKAVGGALPVIGGLIGPAIEAIMNIGGPSKDELAARDTFASFQKQFGTLKQTIDAVGAAYAKAGKTGVESQRDLQRALDATHISAQAEADALATINGVLNQQKQDQADLNAAVQRYGFSIQELGPAMQKQQLDEQAQQLLNDWRLLVGSGIQLSTVNEHMAGSINDYLKLARATGQEVPEAFKGILQKLIDAGDLTDDAGNKITDLQDVGVTFATTMTEGFQKVVDKLQELIAKIPDLAASFANIPAVTIPVTYSYPQGGPDTQFPSIPGASTGGIVTTTGIQHFAGGGKVLPFPSIGSDTVPAMLTPGEMVLNTSQQKRLLDGSGGAVVVNINVAGSIRSERELTDIVATRINEAMSRRRRAS